LYLEIPYVEMSKQVI